MSLGFWYLTAGHMGNFTNMGVGKQLTHPYPLTRRPTTLENDKF